MSKLIESKDLEQWWEKHWQDMPEFSQEDLTPFKTLLVHFYSEDDVMEFSKLLKQRITNSTKFVWFPNTERAKLRELGWKDES